MSPNRNHSEHTADTRCRYLCRSKEGPDRCSPESWLVLTVAAAFLLLGVAGSPLAWVLLHHRRSRSEQLMELRWRKLADQVRALDNRLTQHEAIKPADAGMRQPRSEPIRREGETPSGRDPRHEPALIAVPNLEGRTQRSRCHCQRTQGTLCRDLGTGGYRSHARGDRPGHRTTRRPDRADPRPEASDRRDQDYFSPCTTCLRTAITARPIEECGAPTQ